MRLLQIDSSDNITLTKDLLHDVPSYAILSHTWGEAHEECTFEDLRDGTGRDKPGYMKIRFCGRQARKDGLEHFWVDSACINKSNHAELSEAINSMYRWYRGAQKCYVYLSDVSAHKRDHEGHAHRLWEPAFRKSRWFTRGWTLQELLAPTSVEFFSRDDELLGSKSDLVGLIRDITTIPTKALQGASLTDFSVDERMRWAAKRDTTRVEDKWYCLLGIFEVFMVPIYGEGEHALSRLKDEISKSYRNQLDRIGTNSGGRNSGDLEPSSSDRRKELMASLTFDQMDSRRSTIKSPYPTTCGWLLKHPAYVAWIDSAKVHEHHGFLWIKGKPGAGKSTLVKFAHGSCAKQRNKDEIVVSFFFNARGDAFEKSIIGMYRSLLFQLLNKATDLQEVLDEYSTPGDTIGESPTWSIEWVRDLLSLAIAKLKHRRLKCFIDALDECEEQQVRDMIVFFEELGQNALDGGSQVYVCFASRHYPTIDIGSGLQLTLEDESGHGEDLAKYIQSHLRAGEGSYIEQIRTHIQEKANGVFIWAVLVIEILNKEFRSGRIFAVKRRLNEIPAKLGDLFKDILKRDNNNMEDLLLCIQWILFARRPLTREEFYFAMASGLDPELENLNNWDPEHVAMEDMHRFVLNSSKGLAECTRSKTPTVQFIHESVRDFLIKEDGLRELWPELGDSIYSSSHDQLKRCCLTYLMVNSSRDDLYSNASVKASSKSAKEVQELLHIQAPFLEYASRNLLYHADEAAREVSQDMFLRELALKPLITMMNLFERYNVRRHTTEASLAYVLAENNFARLIRTASCNGFALHTRSERYRFPIFAALANGHREAVRALLQPDVTLPLADITKDLEFGQALSLRDDRTPLLWALNRGHEAVAEALVTSTEIDINVETHDRRNALSLAAEHGHVDIILLLLLEQKAKVDAQDISGQTPLHHAARRGRESAVSTLLEHGADIEKKSIDGFTPISHASREGHVGVVQMLLQRGATIENTDNFRRTPLIWAAYKGMPATLQLLLNFGAKTEAISRSGMKPLLYSVHSGNVATVNLLLEHGANIEATDVKGSTALHRAAILGKADMVKSLVEQGSNIDCKNAWGNTALVHAIPQNQVEVVHLLLKKGANIECANNYGETPLIVAAQYCKRELTEVLIAGGAIVNVQDKRGQTPLLYACMSGDEQTAQILLGSGARVDTAAMLETLMRNGKHVELKPGPGLILEMDPPYNSPGYTRRQRTWPFFDLETIWELENASVLSDNRVNLVQLLLEYGAQPGVKGEDGKSALMLAREKGWVNVLQLLQQYSSAVSLP